MVFLVLAILNLVFYFLITQEIIFTGVLALASIVFFIFIVAFFRSPSRSLDSQEGDVLAAADGEVALVIEVARGRAGEFAAGEVVGAAVRIRDGAAYRSKCG